MAQLKRNQPPRACRNPPPVYREPDLEEETESETETDSDAEEKRKKKLVERKRKRNQYRLRARSPEDVVVPEVVVMKPAPKMDKKLWSNLGDDLVENVLSHLPVYKLWNTVMAINPRRWKQIHSYIGNAHTDGILGHGNHVDSWIGYIKAYTSTWRSLYLPDGDDLRPPPPRVLDHSTQTWQNLPRYPELSVRLRLAVQSVSEGLILLVKPDNVDSHASVGYRHRMVVWNPVSQSYRWLPKSPLPYDNPDYFLCMEVLVVDQDRRNYKVIEFVSSWTTPAIIPLRRQGPYRLQQVKAISGYVVYDSISASWGAFRPMPGYISEVRLNYQKNCVSCDGHVCFVTVEQHLVTWERPRGIACYNPTTDVWSEVSFPPSFFAKLPGLHLGCNVRALLYACGKVYMVFKRMTRAALYSFYVASIALVDIQSGVAAFEQVARVREAEKSSSVSATNHPPPKCWQSRPSELILQRPCVRMCNHRWYILPVGSTFYLCTVLCGRWHRRFDLEAQVWTDFQFDVPSEVQHDRVVVTTLSPSTGSSYYWDANYFPYIPSWIKV